MQNNISSMGDACKKEKEDKQKAVADAKEELLRKRGEVVEKELALLAAKHAACDIDGLGPDALEERIANEKGAHRLILRTMAKRLVELRAAEAPDPKRRRGGNSSAAAATGDATDEECDDAASSAAPASTPAPASASASSAAAAAAPKSKARAKAKSAPMVACEGMTQGGTVQCKRKVPAGTRFCCKHKVDAPVIIPGQQFFCGYKNCTAITSEQGVLCAKCQSLAEDGSVESAACEHCGDKPAADDSKYCKGCIEVLEKELGLADEEKHADGVGGSAEPSTAPGISVEPAPTASAADASDESSHNATSAAVEHELCHRCGKKPVIDDCSDYCADCIAKLGVA
jgi:hypothetical protein